MAYVALYRKYRSQSFDELMGQEAVTKTLQNAIKSGRIAHAYLFHGARGCGKTSTARLLARALNCIAQEGPTPEPCGVCRLCTAIREGSCMDVIEMDAASETGIDDVREKVIENVAYAPGEARYKVYIIDEVHDLSAKAFDALLKTLEEPPAHVIFVLATTEYHKVPVTIRSRCQPYQFKRGTLQDLSASIQRVITTEGYTAEPEAVQSVARAAEGSWRDALSLLEQVIAYSDAHITADAVQRALGTVGSETLGRVVETLAGSDLGATLAIAGELVDSGKDVRQLLIALQGYLRDLMLIAAGARQAAVQELGAERLAQLTPQAALFDPLSLLAMMEVLAAAEKETRFSNQHRWLLERTLCALQPECLPLRRGQATGQGANPAPVSTQPVRSRPEPPPLAAEPTVVPRPPTPAVTQAFATAPEEVSDLEEEPDEALIPAVPVVTSPPSASSPLPSVTQESAPAAEKAERNGAEPPPGNLAEDRFADDVTLPVIQRAWPRILKLVKAKSPGGAGFLEKARPVELEGKMVTLAFADSFSRDRIQNKGRELIESKINEGLSSQGYKIRCVLEDDLGAGGVGTPTGATPTTRTPGAIIAPPPPPEPLTLLDAPISTPAPGSSRIADFEMPVAPPSPPMAPTASSKPQDPPAKAKAPEEPPAETGLLAETLNIFGGEVVNSEPM